MVVPPLPLFYYSRQNEDRFGHSALWLETKWVRVCVCVCEREREIEFMCVCVGERESVCVWVRYSVLVFGVCKSAAFKSLLWNANLFLLGSSVFFFILCCKCFWVVLFSSSFYVSSSLAFRAILWPLIPHMTFNPWRSLEDGGRMDNFSRWLLFVLWATDKNGLNVRGFEHKYSLRAHAPSSSLNLLYPDQNWP